MRIKGMSVKKTFLWIHQTNSQSYFFNRSLRQAGLGKCRVWRPVTLVCNISFLIHSFNGMKMLPLLTRGRHCTLLVVEFSSACLLKEPKNMRTNCDMNPIPFTVILIEWNPARTPIHFHVHTHTWVHKSTYKQAQAHKNNHIGTHTCTYLYLQSFVVYACSLWWSLSTDFSLRWLLCTVLDGLCSHRWMASVHSIYDPFAHTLMVSVHSLLRFYAVFDVSVYNLWYPLSNRL